MGVRMESTGIWILFWTMNVFDAPEVLLPVVGGDDEIPDDQKPQLMENGDGLPDGVRLVLLFIGPEAFGLQVLETDDHRIEARLLPALQERRMMDDRIDTDIGKEALPDGRGEDRLAELLRGPGIAEGVGIEQADEGDVAEQAGCPGGRTPPGGSGIAPRSSPEWRRRSSDGCSHRR